MSKAKWFQFCVVVVIAFMSVAAEGSGRCQRCVPVVVDNVPNERCEDVPHMDPDGGRMECEQGTGTGTLIVYNYAGDGYPTCEAMGCTGTYFTETSDSCRQNCYITEYRRVTFDTCTLSGAFCSTYDPADDGTPGSPAVFKLGNGPWGISTATNGVPFDLAGDGETRRWSWPEQDSGIVFLALDRGVPDGKVTSGRQLFGDATLLRSGARAAHAFEALAELDDNGDRFIDAFDAVYPYLQFWRDNAPRDGVSQSHELTPIASHGVEWISVDYIQKARVDQNGNAFPLMGHAKIGGHVVVFYDVFLKSEAITP